MNNPWLMQLLLDGFDFAQVYGRNMNNLCLNFCCTSSVLLKYPRLISEYVLPPTFSQAMISGSVSLDVTGGQEIPVLWK